MNQDPALRTILWSPFHRPGSGRVALITYIPTALSGIDTRHAAANRGTERNQTRARQDSNL
jgi:hypothetical protein